MNVPGSSQETNEIEPLDKLQKLKFAHGIGKGMSHLEKMKASTVSQKGNMQKDMFLITLGRKFDQDFFLSELNPRRISHAKYFVINHKK